MANWWEWDYGAHGDDTDVGGFGRKDLDKMIEQGYSPAQIRIMANTAVRDKRTPVVYKGVQDWVGQNTVKPPWQYGAHGGLDFGLKDIEEAEKMGGVDYNKIKEYAQYATDQGIGVSQNAKAWLANWNPESMGRGKTPGMNWMNYKFDEVGGPGMGVKDIDDLRRKGYTNAQIRILSNTASNKGVNVWGGASDWIGKNTEALPWQYGAHGAENFGIADVNAALSQGLDYKTIKGYADFAREQGIGVGSSAQDWMFGEEQKSFNEDLKAQQEQDRKDILASQKAHQDAMLKAQQDAAAEAARVQAEQFARSRRVTGSASTGVGGAASIRGARLSITQSGGRSGTRRFSRHGGAQYVNPLGGISSAAPTAKSTITL